METGPRHYDLTAALPLCRRLAELYQRHDRGADVTTELTHIGALIAAVLDLEDVPGQVAHALRVARSPADYTAADVVAASRTIRFIAAQPPAPGEDPAAVTNLEGGPR